MSNKLRVIVIDAEGSDEAVSRVLQGFAGTLAGPRVETALSPPILPEVKELPAPVVKHRGRPRAKAPAQAKSTAPANGADDSQRAAIIAVLEKKPLTPGDLIKATGLPGPSVYTVLSALRKEGVVRSMKSDASVYPLQVLVKK